MKLIVCTALTLLGLLPSMAWGQNTDDLLQLNRRLIETQMLERDPSFLIENSTPEYVVVGPGGVVETRDQVIAGLGAFSRLDSISISREEVRASDGVAIVTNRLELHGELNLPIGPLGSLTASTTFVQIRGRWMAVARSSTPCALRAAERGLC
jgi:hypothetical protein